VVLLETLVDLAVVNHIQEVVVLGVLEEKNQEQIQHMKEILLVLISQAPHLVLMGVVVAVEQIQLTLINHTREETQA
tara:strand:- start:215 stop:445 length:231 start_codon:yes stop_codon:yes gene_type:complete